MAAGHMSGFRYVMVILVALVRIGQSCPELRECFPDIIETVPCDSSTSPVWTTEPSAIDCSMYVSCFNGIGIKMCCPDGMYYSPDTLQCENEENVDCQIEPPACPEQTTTTLPDTSTVTDSEETTTSNPEETTTTDPDTTTIETETTTPDETTSTEPEETTTVGQGPDLQALCENQSTESLIEVAYPGECEQYVVCENQQYIRTEPCPAGLHFNPTLSVCDSPDHAECLEFVCQHNPDGIQLVLESLNSCKKYFICVGNMTVERLCAPGTVYDPVNGWCVIDDVENPCERERPPPPPESVVVQCAEESELKKIPHPTECDVYYRCLNGRLWVRQCPAGLLFDSVREQCNLAEIVPLTIITACCMVLGSAVGSTLDCANTTQDTFLPDRQRCHYYVACVNRATTPIVCPSGYHFNSEKQLCDYPSKAGCIKCPATGFVNLAVDGNCRKFVQCFMGVAVDRECPSGLLFDPSFGQCNIQTRVPCK
uniref:Chitin-binding type-2 domain-containing protein n=1 Tax=Anopheles dirus TaxID=7168 RepID=A0A182NDG7_9DIPT